MQRVSIPGLLTALDIHRTTNHLSWRDVAHHTGLSHSTFSRMRTAGGIDLDGYTSCCNWLGVSLDTFVNHPASQPGIDPGAVEMISVLRRIGVPESYWRALIDLTDQLARAYPVYQGEPDA